MPSYRLRIELEKNGHMVDGFPLVRRLDTDEAQPFDYQEAADNDTTTFSAVPTGQLATVQLLVVRADLPTTYRLDGQSDAGIVLGADGILLIFGATIDAGAATNVTVNNPHASTAAQVLGEAGGT